MLRLRRLYVYLVAFAGQSMLLTGLGTLARVLLEQALDLQSSGVFGAFHGRTQFREQTALGIALTLVGLLVWLLHWRAAQLALGGPAGDDERRSGLRRLYLYAALLTDALAAYSASRDLVVHLLRDLLGLARGAEVPAGIVQPLPYAVIFGLFALYHWRIAAADRALVGEVGASATLRRWYLYGMSVLGVGPLLFNLSAICHQLWTALFAQPALMTLGSPVNAGTVALCGGTVLVALAVWLLHGRLTADVPGLPGDRASEPASQSASEPELHSVLRKVYLYGLVALCVAWALVNASQVVRFFILTTLGEQVTEVGGQPPLLALGEPLSSILVFGVFWAYFWTRVRREAAAEPEVGRQAGVRRLYTYLVSAVALAVLTSGIASFLRLLLDLLLPGAIADLPGSRQSLATYLSMILIGLPVWWLHWNDARRLVAGPSRAEETRATTRRLYLYLAVLASVAVLLTSGAWIVYQLAVMALGLPASRELVRELAHWLVNAAVAGAVLWYHWWLVLRSDLAALREAAGRRRASAVVSGLDPEAARALERFVREQLVGASVRLDWTEDGQREPEADAARVVSGRSDLANSGA